MPSISVCIYHALFLFVLPVLSLYQLSPLANLSVSYDYSFFSLLLVFLVYLSVFLALFCLDVRSMQPFVYCWSLFVLCLLSKKFFIAISVSKCSRLALFTMASITSFPLIKKKLFRSLHPIIHCTKISKFFYLE